MPPELILQSQKLHSIGSYLKRLDIPLLPPKAELLDRFANNPDILINCIRAFLSEYPSVMATIQAACEDQDLEVLREAVHRIKGSTAYFGLDSLVELFEKLRAIEQPSEISQYQQQLDTIQESLTHLEKEFQQLISSLESP